MKNGKIHWSLLLTVAVVTVVMLVLVVLLKKMIFFTVLPLFAIGVVAYLLYTLLLALGYGDKDEKKPEEKDDSNVE